MGNKSKGSSFAGMEKSNIGLNIKNRIPTQPETNSNNHNY